MDSRKGSLDFIKCGARLIEAGYDLALIVSGIGPDFDATRKLAEELGVGGKTYFPGEAHYDDAPLPLPTRGTFS